MATNTATVAHDAYTAETAVYNNNSIIKCNNYKKTTNIDPHIKELS